MKIFPESRYLTAMDSLEETPVDAPDESKANHRAARRFPGVPFGILIALVAVVFLIMDYSDVLFAASRRQAALNMITPGMRLTQAERRLNEARYITLYLGSNPPALQVTTLRKLPLTATLLHKAFPNSGPDIWFRKKITQHTRFIIKGQTDGTVKFTPAGKVAVELQPPTL